MRKVLFKRFEYVDDDRVRILIDEREGYFHGLHIEGRGYDYAVIEDCETGENYQVEPCNYKFTPSDEKESIDWEQRRYELVKQSSSVLMKEWAGCDLEEGVRRTIQWVDEIINQLKNNSEK